MPRRCIGQRNGVEPARLTSVLGKLFLLFTLVPVLELYLLFTIGGVIGPVATIGIVVATGLLGAGLAKHEGLRVLRAWQGAVAKGEIPEEGVVSSLLVLVGGVLLVTPGVVTDILGLSMLLPVTRRAMARVVARRASRHLQITTVGGTLGSPMGDFSREPDDVIDVEARDEPTDETMQSWGPTSESAVR
jgi:UPF0716 protein FxsA